MQEATPPSRLNAAAFTAKLQKHPALFQRFETILGLIEGGVGCSRNIDDIEALTIELTRGLGNEMLTAAAQRVETASSAETRDARGYENRGKKKVRFHSTFGEIELVETQYRNWHTGAVFRPFVNAAGVGCRGFTRALQRVLVDFGIDVPFALVCEKVREHYGIEIPGSAPRTHTLKHAARVTEKDSLPQGKRAAQPLLISEVDGCMVPVMQAAVGTADARKGKVLSWTEMRLNVTRPEGLVTPIFGVTMGDPQETGWMMHAVADAAGLTPQTKVHAVGDGAPWIAEQYQVQFGKRCTYLLDLFHVCEYLAEAAKVCAPTGPKAWVELQKTRLKTGDAVAVLTELNAHAVPDGTRCADGSEDPVFACLRYLSSRRDQLDYASAIAQGLPVGSGEIESAHRYVLQARLKLAGAWWKRESAQAIARMRVARANGQWDNYWENQKLAA